MARAERLDRSQRHAVLGDGDVLALRVEGVQVNGDRVNRLPNTTSVAFSGVESEAMLMLLDQRGVCCSAGSACTTGQHEPSHVLRAMGHDDTRARSSLPSADALMQTVRRRDAVSMASTVTAPSPATPRGSATARRPPG